jgi:hypothetical protein
MAPEGDRCRRHSTTSGSDSWNRGRDANKESSLDPVAGEARGGSQRRSRRPEVSGTGRTHQREDTAHLRHSRLSSNKSRIKRVILPLWGDVPLADVKPRAVEQKINGLPASPKNKLHIKAMMHKIFNFGLKCEMVAPQPNPMRFVTIHGVMPEGIVARIRGDVWKRRGRDMFRLFILSENLQPRAGTQSRSTQPRWKISTSSLARSGHPLTDRQGGLLRSVPLPSEGLPVQFP